MLNLELANDAKVGLKLRLLGVLFVDNVTSAKLQLCSIQDQGYKNTHFHGLS